MKVRELIWRVMFVDFLATAKSTDFQWTLLSQFSSPIQNAKETRQTTLLVSTLQFSTSQTWLEHKVLPTHTSWRPPEKTTQNFDFHNSITNVTVNSTSRMLQRPQNKHSTTTTHTQELQSKYPIINWPPVTSSNFICPPQKKKIIQTILKKIKKSITVGIEQYSGNLWEMMKNTSKQIKRK